MKRRKLKSFVVPTIYVLTIGVFATSMYLIQGLFNNESFTKDDMIYVDNAATTLEGTAAVIDNIFDVRKLSCAVVGRPKNMQAIRDAFAL